jgi:hypothetical protein
MISDVLFHALEEIADYQRRMPEAYSPLRDEIEPVKRAMYRLLVLLDGPPGSLLNKEDQMNTNCGTADAIACEECHEMLPRDQAEEVGDLLVCEDCAGLLTVCDHCGEVARDEDCEYGTKDCDDLLCPDCFEELIG